jgi:diacylglycerol kinase (ATP)
MPPRTALPTTHENLSRPVPRTRRSGLTVVRREVELIVNARASGAADVAARAVDALAAAGARPNLHVTADEGELESVVRAADGRRVVLVGGDGTVHALANLDLPAIPAAALLPAGRANNIARALGIPVDWAEAAKLAVQGRPTAIDALHVATPRRTLFAVEGVSAGFHAAARHRYTGVNSADLTAGVRALVAELLAYRQHALALRADGAPLFTGAAAQAFVSNLPYFGFGFQVDPVADATDGRLEAIVLEAAARRDVVRLLAAARDGKHLGRAGVTWTRAARVELERPVPLVADAQPLGVTTASITIAAGRLRMVVADAPGTARAQGVAATAPPTCGAGRAQRVAATAPPTGGAGRRAFAREARP